MNGHATLRANFTFALDLAEQLGVTVESITVDNFDTVTAYSWVTPGTTVDEIADREGWPKESSSGEGWYERRQTFDVDGRKVHFRLIGGAR